ncbi:MAG: zinc-binding dehydrogenase, partial [Candidatus Eremiobacteraeota bacterium]|nr:zinc-binding dehydrogenase [Candidatus Eremiobacteraeota bacterium]
MGTLPEFRALVSLVQAKGLKPPVDSVWPLERGRDAFAKLAAGDHVGKIGLLISGDSA